MNYIRIIFVGLNSVNIKEKHTMKSMAKRSYKDHGIYFHRNIVKFTRLSIQKSVPVLFGRNNNKSCTCMVIQREEVFLN